jgi:hypothetical protein
VTGAHSFKTGLQWSFGDSQIDREFNGDLLQRYRNGVPADVIVYNTPVVAKEHLNADMGIYAQDSWRIDRLTLNMGVRFEYFNAAISEQTAGAGRFAPTVRSRCPTCRTGSTSRPGWAAYDLGDADGAQGQLQLLHGGPGAWRPALHPWRPFGNRTWPTPTALHRAGQRDRAEDRPAPAKRLRRFAQPDISASTISNTA